MPDMTEDQVLQSKPDPTGLLDDERVFLAGKKPHHVAATTPGLWSTGTTYVMLHIK